MLNKQELEALLPYATHGQAEALKAVMECGNYSRAAKATGRHKSNVRRDVLTVKQRAALKGHAPDKGIDFPLPDHLKYSGVSALERKIVPEGEGGVILQWHKANEDRDRTLAIIREAAEAMAESVPPIEAAPPPKNPEHDIIPWINIGDAHIGMLAHEAETGANFDLKIAEQELCAAISLLIDETGEHERCVINDLGDATHYENFAGVTEASGHPLDYDGRFPRMIKVYIRIMRFIIDKALSKFEHVDVIVNQGNHSRTNDIWMPELIQAAYGHTGRVNIVNNGSIFVAYRMGNTFVMTHHSDKCKPDRLASVMATDFREEWGETQHRYIDIGHIHHKMTSKEHPGVMVESFNILAAPDKYAHDNGYRSRQSITVIDRSRTYGELGRRVLPVERVRDSIRANGGVPYEPKGKGVFVV